MYASPRETSHESPIVFTPEEKANFAAAAEARRLEQKLQPTSSSF